MSPCGKRTGAVDTLLLTQRGRETAVVAAELFYLVTLTSFKKRCELRKSVGGQKLNKNKIADTSKQCNVSRIILADATHITENQQTFQVSNVLYTAYKPTDTTGLPLAGTGGRAGG